ncbi:hypothetical protein LIIV107777_03885 [Listeria ivanovii subsp. ivanovii]|uniref:Uncharacterized protein n=1 Tax=Listeria seeligeri FSL N1-067 TaxID=702453 RepID=E3ZMD1_LISSE|nr:conserved hypothetical protein [Listeria seeligeri FSL N1-067]EFS04272.1 conserved hypothetical protein [Listeria seeligeri FSL S4-171]SNV36686.1 Uncharacterised protein [Listeria ivanovii subsp. ivanovii]SNV82876.1 Uncharacterised protein [Listeria ivanovii subsp. ivanovii]
MNFNYFIKTGITGLILLFIVQCLQFLRGLSIHSGLMDRSIDNNPFNTSLVINPIIFS